MFDLLALGAGLGISDGILNPCALSVLFFLAAYLMSLGSPKKYLKIGLIYSAIIFIVYFLFMYGALNLISVIGFLTTIKKIIGIILILIGILSLKDFFFYSKGPTIEIPKFAKPKIENLIKKATIPSAILLGVLVAFVEIPCAGAFPFSYSAILIGKVSGILRILYLLWYNMFFVLPLVILVLVFYMGALRVEKAEEFRIKSKRYLRLVVGLIMIILGLTMLVGWI